MEQNVSLDELYAVKDILDRISARLQEMTRLKSRIRSMEPELYYYPKRLDMRRLPPPWQGHGWSIVISLWLLAMDVWSGGLFGGLFVVLFNYLRIKKERAFLSRAILMALTVITGFFVVIVITGHISETGSSMLLPFLFFLGAFMVTSALMSGPKKRANQQIEEENQARRERNDAAAQNNEAIQQKWSQLEQQVQQLQNRLSAAVEEYGYPPAYATQNAVNFFIHCVENHWAVVYSSMIDKYRAHMHQQNMEAESRRQTEILKQQAYNQEIIQEQLDRANMLQAAQIATQIRTANEIADAIRSQPTNVYYYNY